MSTQNSDAGPPGPSPSTPRIRVPRTYKCSHGDQCGVFENLIDLDIHMHQRRHWRCPKCGSDYQDRAALSQHDLQDHPEPMNLKCPGCNEKFTLASNLMHHIEMGLCKIVKPELLHLRRKQRQAFQAALRRLNPANELDFLDPMPNDGARPHTKPDSNFIDVVNDVEDYGAVAGPMTTQYRSGTGKAPDLLTGDNLEALNHVPRGENDTFNPWTEPKMETQQEVMVAESPEPAPLLVSHGRRIVDPDHPDFDVAIFYNSVYEEFACPHLRCKKAYKRAKALIDHMQSLTHKPKIQIRCPHCGHSFNTMTAAMRHAEAPINHKCNLQYDKHFRDFVFLVSGCILDIAGQMLNGQTRFVNVQDNGLFEAEETQGGCDSLVSQMARLRVGQPVTAPTRRR